MPTRTDIPMWVFQWQLSTLLNYVKVSLRRVYQVSTLERRLVCRCNGIRSQSRSGHAGQADGLVTDTLKPLRTRLHSVRSM
jgi:hypothetical protein